MAEKRLAGLAAACLSGCALMLGGCSMDAGTGELGPELWTAWVECRSSSDDRMMTAEEVTDLEDGWSCQPSKPNGDTAFIRCWKGEAEASLAVVCAPATKRGNMVLGDQCIVHLACDGQGLFDVGR